MPIKFKRSKHTLILSDLHLALAEPENPKRPLWKKFNRREYFIDDDFALLLGKTVRNLKKDCELILAGDIFDFDSVTETPKNPDFKISWLEKKRGLNSEEEKSLYKIDRLIGDHPVFFRAIRDFILADNKCVFIIGNHDLELHWPSVKEKIITAIGLPAQHLSSVRFCNWYYVSNEDTLVEHGNQYDTYCCTANPIHPFFRHMRHAFIKLPFGNLTHRYMINGMGLFNPHVDSTYLLDFWGYLKTYFGGFKTQPLLFFNWLFGALATLIVLLRDSLAPRIKTPLTIEHQVNVIAENANTEPGVARSLLELHAHPVSWNFWRLMRVLWIDRFLFLCFLTYGSFQLTVLLGFFTSVSWWWAPVIWVLLLPLFVLYTKKQQIIRPRVKGIFTRKVIKLATQITGVSRLVCGHTHFAEHRQGEGIEFLNAGYWSPSFRDIQCTITERNKSFVWIRPEGRNRTAKLMWWDEYKNAENPFEW